MAASMKNRSRGAHSREKREKDVFASTEPEKPERRVYEPWAPTAYTAFKTLLSVRLCAAIWSNISDCDETYNFWEPLHYLLYGYGFQTWEYSPAYAIRSYAYLWLYGGPLKLYAAVLQVPKILQFYFLRCMLGFLCTGCEIYFYRSVCRQFGNNIGRLTFCLLLLSTGMFISATAFLPSTFSMYMTMISLASWWRNDVPIAIFATAASALVGWPFAGAIGIPIAVDIVFRQKQVLLFLQWSLMSAVGCLVPLIYIDSHYFGGIVIAPMNIVLYNVFSSHGPNIYGTEPWTFYLVNGFLNFNIVFFMALVSVPFALIINHLLGIRNKGLPLWLSLGSLYIWLAIFVTQPHKEERFLFPIYPLFPLAAAVTLDYIQKCYHALFVRNSQYIHYTEKTFWLCVTTLAIFATISLSRIFALHTGYHAPMEIYGKFNEIAQDTSIHNLAPDKNVNVCVGKEWYRFPSNFLLPGNNWRMQFVKSAFAGQLPKPYDTAPDATRKIPAHMNDMNREEPTRYINVSKCHYLVDLDLPGDSLYEPQYSLQKDKWKVIQAAYFLDARNSHPVLRAFYIPLLSEKYCAYRNYNILKTTRTKHSSHSTGHR